MSRNTSLCAALAALLALAGTARAEEPAALVEELRALRQLVEQQSKQLETLTRQVAKLAANPDGKVAAPEAEPAAGPTAPAPAPPPTEEFTTVRKAEAAGPPKHVVVKGETLTSIAKHYSLPLPELLKANKDVNERKLQIGQTISIPIAPAAGGAKPAEPPTEKTP